MQQYLTSSCTFSDEYVQNFVPNGKTDLANMTIETIDDGTRIPNNSVSVIKTRSIEETEAAHDLLSLSQSLPPLPAPGAVSIHQPTSKSEELSSITYSPLSPEPGNHQLQTSIPVSVPCYTAPILYVVQVPTIPTPPTSECSSDAENQLQHVCINEATQPGHFSLLQTTAPSDKDDIFIMPLSPEPEIVPSREENEKKTSVVRVESVIVSTERAVPETRRSSRCSKSNKEITNEATEQRNEIAKKRKTVIILLKYIDNS